MHTGALTDTAAHRELMKAIFGYSDRSVDDVIREIESKRHDRQTKLNSRSPRPAPNVDRPIPKSSEDALAKLLADAAKAREALAAQPAPPPPPERKPRAPKKDS